MTTPKLQNPHMTGDFGALVEPDVLAGSVKPGDFILNGDGICHCLSG